jgi:Ca2+-binding RTX toxin-like protein
VNQHGCDVLLPSQQVGNKIYGTSGDDWLCGTNRNDQIYGEHGADHINAKNGHDHVYGGPGRDGILARDGQRDWLFGGGTRGADVSASDWGLVDETLDQRHGLDALKP